MERSDAQPQNMGEEAVHPSYSKSTADEPHNRCYVTSIFYRIPRHLKLTFFSGWENNKQGSFGRRAEGLGVNAQSPLLLI